jgi:RHS repeat-associated protein
VDAADTTALSNFIAGSGGWNLDFNRDGNVDGDDVTDHATYVSGYVGGSGGPGVQSRAGLLNRVGYAGYQWDHIVQGDHVRHRVYLPGFGRWTRRDPAGRFIANALYEYVGSYPTGFVDPSGLEAAGPTSSSSGSPCPCESTWVPYLHDYTDIYDCHNAYHNTTSYDSTPHSRTDNTVIGASRIEERVRWLVNIDVFATDSYYQIEAVNYLQNTVTAFDKTGQVMRGLSASTSSSSFASISGYVTCRPVDITLATPVFNGAKSIEISTRISGQDASYRYGELFSLANVQLQLKEVDPTPPRPGCKALEVWARGDMSSSYLSWPGARLATKPVTARLFPMAPNEPGSNGDWQVVDTLLWCCRRCIEVGD